MKSISVVDEGKKVSFLIISLSVFVDTVGSEDIWIDYFLYFRNNTIKNLCMFLLYFTLFKYILLLNFSLINFLTTIFFLDGPAVGK